MPRQFVFDCPTCGAELTVDADIRSELLEDGCVRCRRQVGPEAFVRRSDADCGDRTRR